MNLESVPLQELRDLAIDVLRMRCAQVFALGSTGRDRWTKARFLERVVDERLNALLRYTPVLFDPHPDEGTQL